MTGEEWLATVFEPRLLRLTRAYRDSFETLRSELRALHACEVLDDEAMARAERRLDDVFASANPRIGAPGSAAAPSTNRLIRVLAPAEPLVDIDATTYVLTSVELWQKHVDLLLAGLRTAEGERLYEEYVREMAEWARQRRAGQPPPEPPPTFDSAPLSPILDLTDDLGTMYESTGSGAEYGPDGKWRGYSAFVPGVPAAATQLIVNIRDADARPVRSLTLAL